MSKMHLDLSPLKRLIPFGIFGGIIGGLGLLFYELAQSDTVKYDVIEASQTVTDNTTHTLVNAHTISRQEGTLYTTFNFSSRHVYVSGHVNGANISGAFTFRGFENDAMIEDVRKAGCETARKTAGLLENYEFGSVFSNSSEDVTAKQTEARTFLQNHCPQVQP